MDDKRIALAVDLIILTNKYNGVIHPKQFVESILICICDALKKGGASNERIKVLLKDIIDSHLSIYQDDENGTR